MTASDRTQMAQITVFGSCLDRFFGTSATNFMRFDFEVFISNFSLTHQYKIIPVDHENRGNDLD